MIGDIEIDESLFSHKDRSLIYDERLLNRRQRVRDLHQR